MTTADVEVIDTGSMVGLLGKTEAGEKWIADNLGTEPWQYMGNVLYIDRRFAGDIIAGMLDDSLIVA